MSERDLLRVFRAVLREDFCAFVVRCFQELYPGSELAMNGHIEVMASRLADVAEGRTRRQIINVPPRHLKSLIGSVAYPAWCLGRDPSSSIMCVSYAQDLSDKLARLSHDHDEPLVQRTLSEDPAPHPATIAAGADYHCRRIPFRHLGWRCSDRARRRHDHH